MDHSELTLFSSSSFTGLNPTPYGTSWLQPRITCVRVPKGIPLFQAPIRFFALLRIKPHAPPLFKSSLQKSNPCKTIWHGLTTAIHHMFLCSRRHPSLSRGFAACHILIKFFALQRTKPHAPLLFKLSLRKSNPCRTIWHGLTTAIYHLCPRSRRHSSISRGFAACQTLLRFFTLYWIKPHVPPLFKSQLQNSNPCKTIASFLHQRYLVHSEIQYSFRNPSESAETEQHCAM